MHEDGSATCAASGPTIAQQAPTLRELTKSSKGKQQKTDGHTPSVGRFEEVQEVTNVGAIELA